MRVTFTELETLEAKQVGTDEQLSFAYVDAMFEVPMRSPRLMWSWQLDLGVWNLEERR